MIKGLEFNYCIDNINVDSFLILNVIVTDIHNKISEHKVEVELSDSYDIETNTELINNILDRTNYLIEIANSSLSRSIKGYYTIYDDIASYIYDQLNIDNNNIIMYNSIIINEVIRAEFKVDEIYFGM